MFFLTLSGEQSAQRLADRLAASAVRLVIGTEAARDAVAHTVEGLVTPLVRDEAPVDTGALRAGLRAEVTRAGTDLVVTWHADVPYADDVLHGTGLYHTPDAHEEWDVYGYQHFRVGGEDVFTMHTHHKGQKPNDFVGRAEERAAEPVRAVLALAGRDLAVTWLSTFDGRDQP